MYVGDGWYFNSQASPVINEIGRHPEPSVIFQLELSYEDGTSERIISDGSELCRTDFIMYSDLYLGEKQDYTYSPQKGMPVLVKEYGYDFLRAQPMNPVFPVREIPAAKIFTSPANEMIVDFGQILAGRARINISVPKGQKVTFEYSKYWMITAIT